MATDDAAAQEAWDRMVDLAMIESRVYKHPGSDLRLVLLPYQVEQMGSALAEDGWIEEKTHGSPEEAQAISS